MAFAFRRLALPDVVVIEPQSFADLRGEFSETYKRSAFAANGITATFVQDNLSRSRRGVLRGLHFQRGPAQQAKLVQCVRGAVWDVAVDLRPDSPQFGRWVAEELSEQNGSMLYVPEGFAHGFQVLSLDAIVMYKVTAEYMPAAEGGLRWNDPRVAIAWPSSQPIISERDGALPLLDALEESLQQAAARTREGQE